MVTHKGVHELLGIELDIDFNLPKNLKFIGYMDVVIHNKKFGRVKGVGNQKHLHMVGTNGEEVR